MTKKIWNKHLLHCDQVVLDYKRNKEIETSRKSPFRPVAFSIEVIGDDGFATLTKPVTLESALSAIETESPSSEPLLALERPVPYWGGRF